MPLKSFYPIPSPKKVGKVFCHNRKQHMTLLDQAYIIQRDMFSICIKVHHFQHAQEGLVGGRRCNSNPSSLMRTPSESTRGKLIGAQCVTDETSRLRYYAASSARSFKCSSLAPSKSSKTGAFRIQEHLAQASLIGHKKLLTHFEANSSHACQWNLS
jgi:hypothetical protein